MGSKYLFTADKILTEEYYNWLCKNTDQLQAKFISTKVDINSDKITLHGSYSDNQKFIRPEMETIVKNCIVNEDPPELSNTIGDDRIEK